MRPSKRKEGLASEDCRHGTWGRHRDFSSASALRRVMRTAKMGQRCYATAGRCERGCLRRLGEKIKSGQPLDMAMSAHTQTHTHTHAEPVAVLRNVSIRTEPTRVKLRAGGQVGGWVSWQGAGVDLPAPAPHLARRQLVEVPALVDSWYLVTRGNAAENPVCPNVRSACRPTVVSHMAFSPKAHLSPHWGLCKWRSRGTRLQVTPTSTQRPHRSEARLNAPLRLRHSLRPSSLLRSALSSLLSSALLRCLLHSST